MKSYNERGSKSQKPGSGKKSIVNDAIKRTIEEQILTFSTANLSLRIVNSDCCTFVIRRYIHNLHTLIIIHSINLSHCQWNTDAPNIDTGASWGART